MLLCNFTTATTASGDPHFSGAYKTHAMGKPTFYTAFANSTSEKDFLPNLSEEALKIADLLQKLAFDDRLYYVKDEIFNLDRLVMNFSKYGERFDIFYFSGHGNDGCLRLTGNFSTGLMPMANVINSTLKNLQLGFFNACETFDLAKEIIVKRSQSKTAGKLVLIACRNDINTFVAERFATLFFTQIGQPGTYKDAYDQAKSLVSLIKSEVQFKEFYTVEDVVQADKNFDYAYIEIDFGQPATSASPAAEKNSPPQSEATATQAPTSIIGNNTIVNDALTTNYLNEVINTLSNAPMEARKVQMLSSALEAAQKVSQGAKMNSKLNQIFKNAADALPGVPSSAAFQSLINVEKHKNDPMVQKIINNDNNSAIGSLVDVVSNIKI